MILALDCLLQSATGVSLGVSSYSSGSSSGYVTGTCSYTAAMPVTSGTHTYTVLVYPGAKAVPVSVSVGECS